jgi:hypothetical protein
VIAIKRERDDRTYFQWTRGLVVEVAVTMNFLCSCNRWHEESKRRYEELARYWLELAEQRQRSA